MHKGMVRPKTAPTPPPGGPSAMVFAPVDRLLRATSFRPRRSEGEPCASNNSLLGTVLHVAGLRRNLNLLLADTPKACPECSGLTWRAWHELHGFWALYACEQCLYHFTSTDHGYGLRWGGRLQDAVHNFLARMRHCSGPCTSCQCVLCKADRAHNGFMVEVGCGAGPFTPRWRGWDHYLAATDSHAAPTRIWWEWKRVFGRYLCGAGRPTGPAAWIHECGRVEAQVRTLDPSRRNRVCEVQQRGRWLRAQRPRRRSLLGWR